MGIVQLVLHLLHCKKNSFGGKNIAMAIKLMLLFFLVSTTTFFCCNAAMSNQAETENIRQCMVKENKCANMTDLSRQCRKCVKKLTKHQNKAAQKAFKQEFEE